MGLADRLRQLVPRPWDGTTGRPRSSNGASSFHLNWVVPPGAWVVAEATLEIDRAPRVPALYFWALQVSFADHGRHGGAGHIGLQWHQGHPGAAAVNWGGYGPSGGELRGSASPLPSQTRNVNTRDYSWMEGRPYRLRVSRSTRPAADGLVGWRGEVIDLQAGVVTEVRDLWAAGSTLASPTMWSEVFADCDDPTVVVRWSDLRLTDVDDRTRSIDEVTVNYQTRADGGCARTDSHVSPSAAAFEQCTAVERITPQGTTLRLG